MSLNTNLIRERLKQNGWTQQDLLLEMINTGKKKISQASINTWLCGRGMPRPEAMFTLSQILNIPMESLLKKNS